MKKMVYRNKIEDEKKFLKNHYLKVGIPFLIALPVYFFMLNLVFDSREKWIMYFSLSLATVFVIAVMLISWRILKKNYEKYELEISESELVSRTGKFQRVIKINELAKVDFSKRDRIFVYDIKGNLIIINDYLNGFEEIKKLLGSKEISEENKRLLRKNKIAKIVKDPTFILYLIIILMLVIKFIR
ncbi:MAG: hypothetical protein IKQ23_13370 [Treponema sp.]|nr:hypothetical protein [Treponema sp.]